jgi:hypothetical protein
MRRRDFIKVIGSGAVAWPLLARAQQAGKTYQVGFLRVGQPPKSFVENFERGLREQGLIEGQNIAIEWGLASSAAQLPDALAKLIRLKVDVLLASGTSAVLLTRGHVAKINYCHCDHFRARHLVLSNRRLGASDSRRRSRQRPELGSNRKLPCRRHGWVQPNAQ